MLPVIGTLRDTLHGKHYVLSGLRFFRCPKCGQELLTEETCVEIDQRVFPKYRKQLRLLEPEQILDLRKKVGLLRREVARLLRVEPGLIAAWEEGDLVPTPTEDAFLRVLGAWRGAKTYLRTLDSHRGARSIR